MKRKRVAGLKKHGERTWHEIGIGENVTNAFKTAKEKMYEDKSDCCKTTGKERRK